MPGITSCDQATVDEAEPGAITVAVVQVDIRSSAIAGALATSGDMMGPCECVTSAWVTQRFGYLYPTHSAGVRAGNTGTPLSTTTTFLACSPSTPNPLMRLCHNRSPDTVLLPASPVCSCCLTQERLTRYLLPQASLPRVPFPLDAVCWLRLCCCLLQLSAAAVRCARRLRFVHNNSLLCAWDHLQTAVSTPCCPCFSYCPAAAV
jgi:hypothetical protein